MLNENSQTKKAMGKLFLLSLIMILLFNEKSYGQVDLTNGLLAYYPFNGNADDLSGNANHGTNINTVLTTDRFGVADKAYDFNGAYISIPSSTSLESPIQN